MEKFKKVLKIKCKIKYWERVIDSIKDKIKIYEGEKYFLIY